MHDGYITCTKCHFKFHDIEVEGGKCTICGTKNDRRKRKAWNFYEQLGNIRKGLHEDWPKDGSEPAKHLKTKLDLVILLEGAQLNRWFIE